MCGDKCAEPVVGTEQRMWDWKRVIDEACYRMPEGERMSPDVRHALAVYCFYQEVRSLMSDSHPGFLYELGQWLKETYPD